VRIRFKRTLCEERWMRWKILTAWEAGCCVGILATAVVAGVKERLVDSRAGTVCEE